VILRGGVECLLADFYCPAQVFRSSGAFEPESAENLCHLGKAPAERGRTFGMRRAGLGPAGGGMIFGLWA
jgi:hypothetical protein